MGLGELSTLLVWGATTAYAIALVAFAVDLARLADVRVQARERVPALVGAGAEAGAAGPSGTADGEAPGRAPVRRRALGIAMATSTLGLLLHLVGTVLRGLAAGRVPWANLYEFDLVGSLVAVGVFLGLCRLRDVRFLGTLVMAVVVPALGLGLTAFYSPAQPVEPVLDSYWLVIHVSIATIATGLFTVSFASSVLQLLRDSRDAGSPRLVGHVWRFLDGLPPAKELERLSFRITAVGFVLWTFTIMAGAVWAEHSWGRYWGWDPKETWSFVAWVVYAAYLHARTTRGWSGRRAAWFVIAGFVAVVWNRTGVNLLFDGEHSYADVD